LCAIDKKTKSVFWAFLIRNYDAIARVCNYLSNNAASKEIIDGIIIVLKNIGMYIPFRIGHPVLFTSKANTIWVCIIKESFWPPLNFYQKRRENSNGGKNESF
jgi:hypothetical protein